MPKLLSVLITTEEDIMERHNEKPVTPECFSPGTMNAALIADMWIHQVSLSGNDGTFSSFEVTDSDDYEDALPEEFLVLKDRHGFFA